MFDFGGAKTGVKPAAQQFRTERTAVPRRPAPVARRQTPLSAEPSPRSRSGRASQGSSSARSSESNLESRTSGSSVEDSNQNQRKRKTPRQASPVGAKFSEDEDDDGEGDAGNAALFEDVVHKRRKPETPNGTADTKRKLRSRKAFSEEDHGVFTMIHAADIVSPTRKSNLPDRQRDKVTVELKYPSASQRERYDLVFAKDTLDPTQEICTIAQTVQEVYLTEDQRKSFIEAGIIRKIQRAKWYLSKDKHDQDLLDDFKDAVHVYNEELERLIMGGVLATNLDNRHDLPHDMVHLILGQVYDRAVSPQVDLLKAYENGTDNVYGELLHPFVSRILKETKLKSDQIFVDLGSGVGNVVLQAALEVGCESWGCEMMENATKLAERQEKEFEARCRLWGVQPGNLRLEKGDFLENGPIQEAIKSADVILVNNQAFTSDLNRKLVDLFLDVKDGCQIVSLQPFGKLDKDITPRNIGDPACSLRPDNKERTFSARDVSWTDGGGWYHIATKDRQRQQRKIEEFGSQ